jgi:hypothetical protein
LANRRRTWASPASAATRANAPASSNVLRPQRTNPIKYVQYRYKAR